MLLLVACLVCVVALVLRIASALEPSKMDWKGAHVVITGGSKGIGKALALQAARLGSRVTLLARNRQTLEEAKADVEKVAQRPGSVHVASMDVCGSYLEIKAIMDEIVEKQGPVDILVNNAGQAMSGEFENLEVETFDFLMQLNYVGAVKATKAVVDQMKRRRRGRIVFVSSQAGQIGLYGFTAYSPTKAALRSLGEALQMELLPYNVYVSVCFPPDTDTPGLEVENQDKPKITKMISNESGLFSADAVADCMVSGIEKGKFHIWCGLDGFMLNFLTTGMAPVHHVATAALQVCTMSLFRLVSLFYLVKFNQIVKKEVNKKKSD